MTYYALKNTQLLDTGYLYTSGS